jgi:molybdopterin/thiamine biosynthesis adenylyltransferase/rhodanese-related sulfurtransferase
MPSFRDMLAQAKSEIREVTTAEADEMRKEPGAVVLDVREADEFEQGAIPGAVFIPRGTLESGIEGRIPDKDTSLIVHCAGGVRSALAVKSLQELGYTNAVSVMGGFNQWKDEGREWKTPQTLTPEQRNRYKRHLLLPEVGDVGQQKLLDAKVLLLGAGGLGSPAALYLAAAGVGTIGIIDMDVVDDSNLQRQVLHNVERIGDRKVDSAKKTLTLLNPDVNVVTYDQRLGEDNVMQVLSGPDGSGWDAIVDGTDNFPTRYLVNDASVKLGIPVVHGSIFRFEGMVTVFDPQNGPTYRDMVPEPPPADMAPSCAEAGVLGVLPGIVGSLQAIETIKLILGLGDTLSGRLLAYDALETSFREYKVQVDPTNEITYANRERIQVAEVEGLCAPLPLAPPPGD